ncbi:ABC transporter permease [Actinopolymorpha alba]|uniref:ABC transporter permease n=1 Tax=Actinopolymorpha alba TaxID=533267 RepID=UPI00037E0B9B|nr:ABC-2 family transporter protein [Actinopolymorpha alba]
MSRPTPKAVLEAYGAIARVNAGSALAYRADYVVGILGLLVQVFLLRMVWEAVYADRGSVDGVDLSTTIAYATLATVQYWLSNPWNFSVIPQRVREGKIAIDLSRPVSFLGQVVAGQVGTTAALAPFALVAVPFTVLVGGAQPPPSVGAGLAYVVSLGLAYVITILLSSLVGLSTFWTLEVGGFFMIYRMVSQFLAGALVPLWFMPDWLRTVAEVLPFQAATYTPLAVYLGRLAGPDLAAALIVQAGWIVLLWLVLRLVWSRALHRVVVQGG